MVICSFIANNLVHSVCSYLSCRSVFENSQQLMHLERQCTTCCKLSNKHLELFVQDGIVPKINIEKLMVDSFQ